MCVTFNTNIQKKDFDILAITKLNYEENKDQVYAYLKHDVMSLAEIVIGLNKIYNNFGINLNQVLTSSAFSLRCVQKAGFVSFIIRNQTMRDFIRSCLYGGRTQHIFSRFEEGLPKLNNVLDKWWGSCVDDCFHEVRVKDFKKLVPFSDFYIYSVGIIFTQERFVVALDANSLYPTAMCNFPVHNGRVKINDKVNNVADLKPDVLYFCQVDVIKPPPNLIFPILPVRKEDHIEWSGSEIIDGTYTSIDLREAVNRRCNILGGEELVLNRGYLVESARSQPIIMPTNIAAEILSNSKVIMNRLIDCCGGITDQPCGFYTDTDSLYVVSSKLPILERKGYLGQKLGQFKNDLGDKEFIILFSSTKS